jgi:hypothetical protein
MFRRPFALAGQAGRTGDGFDTAPAFGFHVRRGRALTLDA